MDINYTRGNISKAVFHLVTADTPMPQRAWDAYNILIPSRVRDGLEFAFFELDRIFKDIRYDEVTKKIQLQDARRAGVIMLEMYDSWKDPHESD